MLLHDHNNSNLTIHEVIGGKSEYLETLLQLHHAYFPQYSQYLPYMRQRVERPARDTQGSVEHWWLAEYASEMVGFILFKTIPKRHCSLGLLIAVLPAYRKQLLYNETTLAEYLIQGSLNQLKSDLAEHRGEPALGMVVEVETPRLVDHYRQYGFIEIPVDYCSPPYIRGETAFENQVEMDKWEFLPSPIGIFPCSESHLDFSDANLVSDLVQAWLVDHYHLPFEHPIVQRVLNSMNRKGEGPG